MPKSVVVIPCYQEEMRLEHEAIDVLCARDISVLLVDDGSSDGTLALLRRIEARAPDKISVLPLSPNRGKAEAVRLGMLDALARGASQVGFADADMATPASEMVRLVRALEESPALIAVMGSRIARAGAHIDRKPSRHYLGRVFSTLASLVSGSGWRRRETCRNRSGSQLLPGPTLPTSCPRTIPLQSLSRTGSRGCSLFLFLPSITWTSYRSRPHPSSPSTRKPPTPTRRTPPSWPSTRPAPF